MDMPDHGTAFSAVMKLLERDSRLVPEAIGHRMVHGGAIFKGHVIVDETAFHHLEEVQDLAPIHNPPALRLLEKLVGAAPHDGEFITVAPGEVLDERLFWEASRR